MGAVYFRNDGTACGLVEGDGIQSVDPLAKTIRNAQDLKENFKEDLIQTSL